MPGDKKEEILGSPEAATYGMVDYSVESTSRHQIVVRLEFTEPNKVSRDFRKPDMVVITLKLAQFKDGYGRYIKNGIHVDAEMPQ